MKMSEIVAGKYQAYNDQYTALEDEDPTTALKHGEEAAQFDVDMTIAQSLFQMGSK